MMSASTADLINGYLDETLTAEELDEFSRRIREDPKQARQFAEAVMLHDRLRSVMLARQTLDGPLNITQRTRLPQRRWLRRPVAVSAVLGLILVAAMVIRHSVSSPLLAADQELHRILQAAESITDRTYSVTAPDDSDLSEPSPVVRGTQPSVDGAVLHVRGPDQYVLTRYFADGSRFITGSDGTTAWSVPPQGRIHLSSNPHRFRGAVPGQQHSIPFIDMRSSLQQLQQSYQLLLSPETSSEGWRRLDATRKSTAQGGPKRVSIWYEPHSGTIHRMMLERLPQARPGPHSVSLELVDQSEFPEDFFSHESHHEHGRMLEWEP